MGSINLGRVLLGGFVAGIVVNVFEFVLNGVLLADQWPGVMASINRPALSMHDIVAFNIFGFVAGNDQDRVKPARQGGVNGAAHKRFAAHALDQFVAAHPAGSAGGQDDTGDAPGMSLVAQLDQFGQDGDGDFGRRPRPDCQSHRTVNFFQFVV